MIATGLNMSIRIQGPDGGWREMSPFDIVVPGETTVNVSVTNEALRVFCRSLRPQRRLDRARARLARGQSPHGTPPRWIR